MSRLACGAADPAKKKKSEAMDKKPIESGRFPGKTPQSPTGSNTSNCPPFARSLLPILNLATEQSADVPGLAAARLGPAPGPPDDLEHNAKGSLAEDTNRLEARRLGPRVAQLGVAIGSATLAPAHTGRGGGRDA